MMDEQTLERAALLQKKVHDQGQYIIGYKREIERLRGEVVQLKGLVKKALSDPEAVGAAPIVQHRETDVPVQNEPLITPVSPPDEPEVLGDPGDGSFWRKYYCDVLVTIVTQYPPDVNVGLAVWSDAVATDIVRNTKKRFPRP